jgi:hypothetical protein
VVSYDVFRTVVPDDAERCRAGTHPDPCAAVTKTNSGHSVSRWPTSSGHNQPRWPRRWCRPSPVPEAPPEKLSGDGALTATRSERSIRVDHAHSLSDPMMHRSTGSNAIFEELLAVHVGAGASRAPDWPKPHDRICSPLPARQPIHVCSCSVLQPCRGEPTR